MVAPSGVHPLGDGTANGSTREEAPPGASPSRNLAEHAGEIAKLLARLARIQVARSRVRAQRVVLLAIAGIVLLLGAAAAVLSGVRLAVRGLAAGLAEAFGGRVWLGELLAGAGVIAGVGFLFLLARALGERRVRRDLGGFDGDEASQSRAGDDEPL